MIEPTLFDDLPEPSFTERQDSIEETLKQFARGVKLCRSYMWVMPNDADPPTLAYAHAELRNSIERLKAAADQLGALLEPPSEKTLKR